MVNFSDMQVELYILSAEEQLLSTKCRCHSVLWHWFSLHHHLHHHQLHALSSSYPKRVSWTFFRLSLCQFSDKVPWLFRVVFQLSLERLWLPLTRLSLPSDCPKNHVIWVDLVEAVPMDCSKIPLECLLRTVYLYYLLCIYYIRGPWSLLTKIINYPILLSSLNCLSLNNIILWHLKGTERLLNELHHWTNRPFLLDWKRK
jgi:hypothetical protein